MADDGITDEDLYGDLVVNLKQEYSYNELKKLYDASLDRVTKLEKENKELKEQVEVLKKNISSLYLTAKNEVTRKDAEIERLLEIEMKQRMMRLQSSK